METNKRNFKIIVIAIFCFHQTKAMETDTKSLDIESEIHQAARNGDNAMVQKLLTQGTDVDSVDKKKTTPLMVASFYGQKEIVKTFIQANAQINAQNIEGRTSLMAAAFNGHYEVVQALLTAKADPSLKDTAGLPTILAPCIDNHPLVLQELINANADVNVRTPIKLNTPLIEAVLRGHLNSVIILLQAQARTDICERNGAFPLHIAAANGTTEIAEELIKAKASINAGGRDGWTPLAEAAANGHRAIVQKLLSAKADVDKPSNNLKTPLILAAINGHGEIVDALLCTNPLVEFKDLECLTALSWAALCNKPKICASLIRHGVDSFYSYGYGNNEIFIPNEIFTTDVCGDTAFGVAAMRNHGECMRALICNSYFLERPQKLRPKMRLEMQLKSIVQCFRTALMSFKQLGLSRDIAHIILCHLHEEMFTLIQSKLHEKKNIPPFALEVTIEGIYRVTRSNLQPVIDLARDRILGLLEDIKTGQMDEEALFTPCDLKLLDTNQFDTHYGTQLRETIRLQVINRHLKAKKTPDSSQGC